MGTVKVAVVQGETFQESQLFHILQGCSCILDVITRNIDGEHALDGRLGSQLGATWDLSSSKGRSVEGLACAATIPTASIPSSLRNVVATAFPRQGRPLCSTSPHAVMPPHRRSVGHLRQSCKLPPNKVSVKLKDLFHIKIASAIQDVRSMSEQPTTVDGAWTVAHVVGVAWHNPISHAVAVFVGICHSIRTQSRPHYRRVAIAKMSEHRLPSDAKQRGTRRIRLEGCTWTLSNNGPYVAIPVVAKPSFGSPNSTAIPLQQKLADHSAFRPTRKTLLASNAVSWKSELKGESTSGCCTFTDFFLFPFVAKHSVVVQELHQTGVLMSKVGVFVGVEQLS